MNKTIHSYIEDLFKGYEDTAELRDFKEEIISNLNERIQDLQHNGLNKEEAFTKAIAELGDIKTIADEISRQKRNEVIGNMYIQQGVKTSLKHAFGYAAAGAVLLFGIISALITYFSTEKFFYGVSALLPFLVVSETAFVFLGLTQETIRCHGNVLSFMHWRQDLYWPA